MVLSRLTSPPHQDHLQFLQVSSAFHNWSEMPFFSPAKPSFADLFVLLILFLCINCLTCYILKQCNKVVTTQSCALLPPAGCRSKVHDLTPAPPRPPAKTSFLSTLERLRGTQACPGSEGSAFCWHSRMGGGWFRDVNI